MQHINFSKNTVFFYYFLFCVSIFTLGLYLFYLEATNQIASDLSAHLDFIHPIVSGQMKRPHEGFEYTVYLLSKLFNNAQITASIIVLSTILVIIASIKFFLLKRLTNVSANLALIFSLSLMLVSAICLPQFNSNLYIGQGSPTVWHNPTLLCVKPFAFLCVYLTISALESFNRKLWIILSVLLLISLIYKPSFGIVFIPALCLYILCMHTKNCRAYLYSFLMILPSLLFLLTIQLYDRIFLPGTNNSFIFLPFGVLHLYTPNVFISFILATAFPLFFAIINPRRVFSNRYLILSWLMLGIGYLQFALFAETKFFESANFAWGFLIALDLLFVFSFIEFITWCFEISPTRSSLIIPIFLILLYLTHLISGIAYLGRYMMTGIYL